jgi:excinuclease ABC subunit B
MNKFKLVSKFKPTGDQPKAIKELVSGLDKNYRDQTLLGVTGSGKTFTMANVVQKVQKPTLIISHNKTLAAQLYSEFLDFFPENAVHYFVSYYDYYQPEAYVPRTDTYIEKETDINEEIDRLRHAATSALLTRRDVLIVASVSCIYGLGSPEDYQAAAVRIIKGKEKTRNNLIAELIDIQYQRNDFDFARGRIRVRGDIVDIFPVYARSAYRVEFFADSINKLYEMDPLTGQKIRDIFDITIYPAKHFVTPHNRMVLAIKNIRRELSEQVDFFKRQGKELEAQRIKQRTEFDIEMMEETGICPGIENYSRQLSFRKPGEPPWALIDYFRVATRKQGSEPKANGSYFRVATRKQGSEPKANGSYFPSDYLTIIDESHMTVPQIGGMYKGDRSRKKTLINYGFRLPSALDNRPLKFSEFEKRVNQVIYTSATPGIYELRNSKNVVEQIVRPTGLLDPEVKVQSTKNQIDDLISEINLRVKKKQRVLVTTLSKKMAEDLSDYLGEMGIKTEYLHYEIDTLERVKILRNLRLGVYDVLVGINLLREGLDLPEVSLVAIMDADKEGFLRSDWALIQVMGRAARHVEGKAIMYGDKITLSMKKAIFETNRRRKIQEEYNKKHHIIPKTITKEVREGVGWMEEKEETKGEKKVDLAKVRPDEINYLMRDLEDQMNLAAQNLEFEKAATLRDQIKEIKEEIKRQKLKKKLST